MNELEQIWQVLFDQDFWTNDSRMEFGTSRAGGMEFRVRRVWWQYRWTVRRADGSIEHSSGGSPTAAAAKADLKAHLAAVQVRLQQELAGSDIFDRDSLH